MIFLFLSKNFHSLIAFLSWCSSFHVMSVINDETSLRHFLFLSLSSCFSFLTFPVTELRASFMLSYSVMDRERKLSASYSRISFQDSSVKAWWPDNERSEVDFVVRNYMFLLFRIIDGKSPLVSTRETGLPVNAFIHSKPFTCNFHFNHVSNKLCKRSLFLARDLNNMLVGHRLTYVLSGRR